MINIQYIFNKNITWPIPCTSLLVNSYYDGMLKLRSDDAGSHQVQRQASAPRQRLSFGHEFHSRLASILPTSQKIISKAEETSTKTRKFDCIQERSRSFPDDDPHRICIASPGRTPSFSLHPQFVSCFYFNKHRWIGLWKRFKKSSRTNMAWFARTKRSRGRRLLHCLSRQSNSCQRITGFICQPLCLG